jgi:hypothetical protein
LNNNKELYKRLIIKEKYNKKYGSENVNNAFIHGYYPHGGSQ